MTNGVTSSNFDSIKDDLPAAIADTLEVHNSTVSLILNPKLRPVVSKCRDTVPYGMRRGCNAKRNCPILRRKGYCERTWMLVKSVKTCSTAGLRRPQAFKKVKIFCKKSCRNCGE